MYRLTRVSEDLSRSRYLGMRLSSFKIPGEYKVVVEGMGCSYYFEIDPDIFRDAFYYSCRGLYHQRSGIERKPEFTKWIRPADHNPEITPEYFGAKTRHKVYLTSVRNSDLTDESGHNQKEYILSHIIDTLENCWDFTMTLVTGTVTALI